MNVRTETKKQPLYMDIGLTMQKQGKATKKAPLVFRDCAVEDDGELLLYDLYIEMVSANKEFGTYVIRCSTTIGALGDTTITLHHQFGQTTVRDIVGTIDESQMFMITGILLQHKDTFEHWLVM